MASTGLPRTRQPGAQAVIPNTPVTSVAPVGVTKKQQIGDLITHLSKQDNHLWQALTSLQSQSNALTGNTTSWTSWNPAITDDLKNPAPSLEVGAYFMTMGPLLFIEIYAQFIVPSSASFLQISLPVDVGQTVFKTCAAWMVVTANPTSNGIIAVIAQQRLIHAYINPTFRSAGVTLMLGGPIGIIQGS